MTIRMYENVKIFIGYRTKFFAMTVCSHTLTKCAFAVLVSYGIFRMSKPFLPNLRNGAIFTNKGASWRADVKKKMEEMPPHS